MKSLKFLSRPKQSAFFFLLFLALCAGCVTQEGRVEISVDDYTYNESASRLTVRLTARNVGDVGVRDVKCTVKVVPNLTPFSSPVATEEVSFGGTISKGGSRTETVNLEDVGLTNIISYSIRIENIRAEVDSKGLFECSKPTV